MPSKPAEEQPYLRKLQTVEESKTIESQKSKSTTDSADKSNEDTHPRGVKQKNTSDIKNFNQLLDVVKQEKKPKIDSFSSRGYVLKDTQQPQSMEVDVSGDSTDAEEQQLAEENEESINDFVFVSN